jgi:mercuric ion transport protein
MYSDRWFRIGLGGSILAALCCFTPLAVWLLGVAGLGALAIWLDVILFPLLLIFGVILVAAILRLRRSAE